MTPAEITGRLMANIHNRNKHNRDLDWLAWASGLYMGKAYHEPKKFPKRPDLFKEQSAAAPKKSEEPVEEEAIKDMLIMYAEMHNTSEEVKTNGSNARRTGN